MNIIGFDYVEFANAVVNSFAYGLVIGSFLGLFRFIIMTGVERREE